MTRLPVCYCGDPGTYALDVVHPAGVGADEHVWLVDGLPAVARCRAHAGPFAVEIVEQEIVDPHDRTPGPDDRPLPLAWRGRG